MISVRHRSLSGRAIQLIIWSTELDSEIDLFLFNIKLFYKFSKSQNNAHVTFGSISTAFFKCLRDRKRRGGITSDQKRWHVATAMDMKKLKKLVNTKNY